VTVGLVTQRFRLDLAYDGTDFKGWAVQPRRRTVQGVVEAALERITGEVAAVTVAGRTDAGVHARGQVCHVDLTMVAQAKVTGQAPRPVEVALLARLAGVLPPDVTVSQASLMPPGFDARFSALWRRYCYRIVDQTSAVDPLRRRYEWRSPRALELRPMAAAARRLLGEHDFAAFCRAREGASTVRTLQGLEVDRVEPGRIEIWVQADAFCHHMVRAISGALVAVGRGQVDALWVAQTLAAGQREPAVTVLPARGLTLEKVAYPALEQMAAQAAKSRVKRGKPNAEAEQP